jgi:pantoate--beta-alanine ligase
MERAVRLAELRERRGSLSAPVGFVPTMGALHAGHAALVRHARRECASVVVSVFVNPLQFGPNEDFAAYPRSPEGDHRILEQLGADLVFSPTANELFPRQLDVFVEPTALAQHFEGERRPGHFRGVATIVLKLLHLVQPHRAYFGEKDAQQLAVIRRLVDDLDVPVEIVACPTVRESDGLALSSRNAYLTAEQRRAAPNLHAALSALVAEIERGNTDVNAACAKAREHLAPLREDYLGVVDPREFRPLGVAPPGRSLLAIGAAYAGPTRLIDNLRVQSPIQQEVMKR